MPVFRCIRAPWDKNITDSCGIHCFPNSVSLWETFHGKFGEQKFLWSFPSFIIKICHQLQTLTNLYSGWHDQSRTVSGSSPFLSLYFALATWPLKKGLGRLAPLGNFCTDPLQVMFSKRQVECMCYVNSVERTKFLFFSCVVVSLSLSFFPCYPFDFYTKLSLKLVSTITPCMSWV